MPLRIQNNMGRCYHTCRVQIEWILTSRALSMLTTLRLGCKSSVGRAAPASCTPERTTNSSLSSVFSIEENKKKGKIITEAIQTCTIRRPVAAADSTAATRRCLGCIFLRSQNKIQTRNWSENSNQRGADSDTNHNFQKWRTKQEAFPRWPKGCGWTWILKKLSACLAILWWAVSDALGFALLHSDLLIEHYR